MQDMSNSQATILVIDDQPGIRRLLTEVLQDEGYNVLTAANGYEGIQVAIDVKPAVILMDMKMPGMDGIEALKELKRQGQGDQVIMMTAYGELDMVNEAREAGMRDYITKPFDIMSLCQIIEANIDSSSFTTERRLLIG
ncbi:Protein-glutamate methylesterase/protein-glutamine glutaminase [Sporomusa paucivorans]|uniref:Sporulation initiation phosphotransferase F n=3 Tax=Sporomusaceae TaxID=1843490 RepID=A0ABP2C571_9FIRM|nr:sporulation initiation phosphotransferase F [Sporomusa sphaeroides DSM 2875]CVK18693.1 Sporulation initiation phosphotransferase F [Sporomusa sphaeroides DSM 2875]SCM81992.1 Sporulation initiation phosphotransferase F [uncultured Sporomusa sp.]